ncbi:MAG: methyltransferase [Gemmatimonadota bacterium]|nr:methyltransferase [Gemmatimonadota bacterium]
MSDHPTPDAIMQLGMGFWGSKTLLSAIELELFTELAKHPEDLEALRGRLGLHRRSARDFLDALVALGMLEREDGTYRNTPATDLFLDKAKPSYIGGMLEMANHRLYPFWGSLTEALRTGQPQNETRHGQDPIFETLYADPARLKEFLAAMTGVSHGANMAIARAFDWADYSTFADVGTAQGDLVVQIAEANEHLEGIGFDLPVVEPVFEDYVGRSSAAGRIRFVGGDFFEDALPEADVILMGHVLHDWGIDDKRMLIRKAYDALPAGGALIVYESLIDDDRRRNAFGLLMSLNMLIETEEGFDFTGADCARWMTDAGFGSTRVEHLVGPDSMAIGIK